MTSSILGIVALVGVCLVLLILRSARRRSAVITHAELVKRVKRLP